MPEPHRCDETCVCPECGKETYYHRPSGEHACIDLNCKAAHGIVLGMPWTVRR